MKIYTVMETEPMSRYDKYTIQQTEPLLYCLSYDIALQFIKDIGYVESDIDLFKNTIVYTKEFTTKFNGEKYWEISLAWIGEIDIIETIEDNIYNKKVNEYKIDFNIYDNRDDNIEYDNNMDSTDWLI